MTRQRLMAYGVVVVVLLLVFAPIIGMFLPFTFIHGYDGPVATMHSIEHNYPTENEPLIEQVGTSAAWVDPNTLDIADAYVSTGLKVTIQSAPIVHSSEIIDNVTEQVIDHDTKTNTTKTWVVQEVELRMGVTAETYKGGLQDSPGATFWIQLTENPYSVFSNASESIAYFIHIVSYERSEKTGSIEVLGEDQGYNYEIVSLEEVAVPQFIKDGGYTDNAKYYGNIMFPVEVVRAAPTSIAGAFREESRLDLHIQIQVLLFGYWERVVPYIEWKGADDPGLFDGLFETVVLIIGVIGTVLVLLRAKGYWKVIGVVLLWVFVALVLRWSDILGALGR